MHYTFTVIHLNIKWAGFKVQDTKCWRKWSDVLHHTHFGIAHIHEQFKTTLLGSFSALLIHFSWSEIPDKQFKQSIVFWVMNFFTAVRHSEVSAVVYNIMKQMACELSGSHNRTLFLMPDPSAYLHSEEDSKLLVDECNLHHLITWFIYSKRNAPSRS